LVLALAFEEYNKNKHAACWPPAPALSNKTLKDPCILPGGAPTHRRWHFNSYVCSKKCSYSAVCVHDQGIHYVCWRQPNGMKCCKHEPTHIQGSVLKF
jgi:hypothetical protein